ncbi:hypothetical protein GUJ93_ZPchr0013g34688 [Zizania palustris]|uniref:Uncharacterized protein n=1 Tax=Zizania palustris TaxID=103762 RepID=A0A8J6C2P8_ZIZPA|nr:hypothetical protein GUJ93_ZPchr0013g34688 [Zizania palustris]
MDCVVKTWLLDVISDDFADAIAERDTTARATWLAIESQFLGNRTTRALFADQEFRSSQGELSVSEYCRRYKRMAEDLRDLGEPISDRTLVLNIIRGLNERFTALGLHLRRSNPLPTFLQVRDDLQLEELTMAKTSSAPAVALAAASGGSAPAPSTAPPKPQQPAPAGSGGGKQGKRGGKRGGGGGNGGGGNGGGVPGSGGGLGQNPSSAFGGGTHGPGFSFGGGTGPGSGPRPGAPWPSFYNPWSGSIQMWPGPRGSPPVGPTSQPHAFFTGSQGPWDGQRAGQWSIPPINSTGPFPSGGLQPG